jgi:hypothetical protein
MGKAVRKLLWLAHRGVCEVFWPDAPMRQGIPTSCGRPQLRYVAYVHWSKSP